MSSNRRFAPTEPSTVEPFREKVLEWHRQGIAVSSIRQALARQYSYGGSVHAVYRFLRSEAAPAPVATVMLAIFAQPPKK